MRGVAEDAAEAPGTVIGTNPGPAAPAGRGTRIVLQVSGGVPDVTVPDVRGQAEAAARQTLQSLGFTNIRSQPTENDGTFDEGDVVNVNPGPGTAVAPDEEIVLLIALPEASED